MSFLDYLRAQPVFTLFLILGLGYLVGRIRFGALALGPVAGVLFVGLVFGHFGFQMSAGAQALGFALFIFSVGYQAGPRFFDVIKTDGLKYFVLAVTVAGSGLLLAVLLSRWLDFSPGTSAGLLSGGLTSSPTLAAAQEAVRGGTVKPPAGWSAEQLIGNITTGYAITYIFGLIGLILIIKILPALLGIDLVADAAQYAAQSPGGSQEKTGQVAFRVYKVTHREVTEVPIKTFRPLWDGLAWLRLHREGQVIKLGPEERLRMGDEISVVGDISLTKQLQRFGEDVTYAYAEIARAETAQVVVTSRQSVGHALGELDLARNFGVYVERWQRMGRDIPRTLDVALQKGDVLTVVGPSDNVDSVAAALGSAERPSETTDMLTFALGIAVGVVLGSLSITVWGTPIGLGSAGGLLLSGIAVGFIRSVRPTFGRLPGSARWLLMELGLLIFMTGVGLRAGGDIIETFLAAGPKLVFAGAFVTTLPLLSGFVVGRKILRIPPVILLGAITGAMTSGASLSVVTGAAKSDVPALGYAGTYAFANVLLTIAGTIIVALA
jgi:putative transport protein